MDLAYHWQPYTEAKSCLQSWSPVRTKIPKTKPTETSEAFFLVFFFGNSLEIQKEVVTFGWLVGLGIMYYLNCEV